MGRIILDMPESYIFKTEVDVRIGDINYGGHLGHDSFISLLHEARARFINSLGYTEVDVEKMTIIVSDLAVVYKSQSFYGDRLKIEIAVTDPNKYGCDLVYRVTHAVNGSLILQAKTGIVFFDYSENTITGIPENFMRKTGLSPDSN
jgi:acyl-CoA thioesterase FadM